MRIKSTSVRRQVRHIRPLVMAPKGTSATIHGADYDSDGSIWYAIRAKIGNKTYDGYMKGTYLNLSISGAVVTVRVWLRQTT